MNTEGHVNRATAGGGGMRRSMPYSPYTMAAAGLAVVGGLWYFMSNNKKPQDATSRDLSRAGGADRK